MALVVTIAIIIYTVYTYNTEPGIGSLHISCPSKTLLNLYCPGCGMTRFVYYIMHGQILKALSYNVLGLFIVALLLTVYFYFIRWSVFDIPFPNIPLWAAYIFFIVIVVYTIARNIPLQPFTYLAP